MSKIIPNTLSLKNAHPRDANITFDEGPHVYTVYDDPSFTSVTTWVHSHFSHFNADEAIDNMMRGPKMKDPSYTYYGMTKEQIKALWGQNTASQLGTEMHYDIECYYNGLDVQNNSIEYSYFLKFVQDFPELKPYRTEWIVYYEDLCLAGSIDMVFEDTKGDLWIYDWKRTKEISPEAFKDKTSKTACISHLPDCNFYHYALQLNVYKAILEHKYDKKIVGMFLIRLHPDNVYKTYERIEMPLLQDEVNAIMAERKQMLTERNT